MISRENSLRLGCGSRILLLNILISQNFIWTRSSLLLVSVLQEAMGIIAFFIGGLHVLKKQRSLCLRNISTTSKNLQALIKYISGIKTTLMLVSRR